LDVRIAYARHGDHPGRRRRLGAVPSVGELVACRAPSSSANTSASAGTTTRS
jgi:hypothetical protein